MIKLFQNEEKRLLIRVDLNQSVGVVKEKLFNWLLENHSDIFYDDLEMHEGGKVAISDFFSKSIEIQFSGDNGILCFDEIEPELIK